MNEPSVRILKEAEGGYEGLTTNQTGSFPAGITKPAVAESQLCVSEPPEKPKCGTKQAFLLWGGLLLIMIGVPLLIVLYVIHKLSQIH